MPHLRSISLNAAASPGYSLPWGNGPGNGDNCSVSYFTGVAGIPQASDPIEDLNIVLPIGGIGSRFSKEGYRFPKPLINIVGKPMICWLIERLSIRTDDTLWVAVNENIDNEFQVGQLLRKWFPKLDIRLLRLGYLTQGAVETVRQLQKS